MSNILKVIIFSFLSFLVSCTTIEKERSSNIKEKIYYSSSGFALIYDNSFYDQDIINKKINNEKIVAFHSILKKDTPIIIINPENSIFVETKVLKNASYPKIFNIVISDKIAKMLKLNVQNPYVVIREIKKNKTFIAKESNIFDEEKNVATTAPVDEVKIKNLSTKTIAKNKKIKKNKPFYLLISDFYYYDSAKNLKNELSKETKSSKFNVEKINDNKYRLSAGPFKNFNSLKSIYISLNNLGFEDINIYKK